MLQVSHVTKTYGNLHALDDVSLTIEQGEIHAVLGENGAGKSTLMAVLSGFALPDKGRVELSGVAVPLGNPAKIKSLGIEMVHQHFTMVPAFSVAENITLFRLRQNADRHRSRASAGKPSVRILGRISPSSLFISNLFKRVNLSAEALALGSELGWVMNPADKVRDLPVGVQQRIEILKAMTSDSRILILDEPTAVLSRAEVDNLFEVLRTLKNKGKTIILIAHKLGEILRIADRASVLRQGKLVASAVIGDVDEQTLASWMVGGMPAALQKPETQIGPPALDIKDLHVRGNRNEDAVRGVCCRVARGEILGIGGVDGNGQVELAEALAQVRSVQAGAIVWMGAPVTASKVKLGYIPQDRQGEGLALTMSVLDNLLIEGHRKAELRKGPFLRIVKIKNWARGLIRQFSIAVESIQDPVGALSGGNQQKVVVGRTLEALPELLIAVNPTRGLDIQASNYVHRQLLEAKEAAASVVLFSADLDELAAVADRSVFMSSGLFVVGADAASIMGGGG